MTKEERQCLDNLPHDKVRLSLPRPCFQSLTSYLRLTVLGRGTTPDCGVRDRPTKGLGSISSCTFALSFSSLSTSYTRSFPTSLSTRLCNAWSSLDLFPSLSSPATLFCAGTLPFLTRTNMYFFCLGQPVLPHSSRTTYLFPTLMQTAQSISHSDIYNLFSFTARRRLDHRLGPAWKWAMLREFNEETIADLLPVEKERLYNYLLACWKHEALVVRYHFSLLLSLPPCPSLARLPSSSRISLFSTDPRPDRDSPQQGPLAPSRSDNALPLSLPPPP